MSVDSEKITAISTEVMCCNSMLKAVICSLDFRDDSQPMKMENDDIFNALNIIYKKLDKVEDSLINFNIK
ncbi:MAG: hypothetical protein AAGJ37_02585 [Pseudomonadota bacterium]